ncbi:hypothetical protein LPJ56_002876, partial [Coemansia sp. RSA 2599]
MDAPQEEISRADIATETTQLLPTFGSMDTLATDADALQSRTYLQERSLETSVILKQEAAVLLKTSIPVVLTYLLQYSFSFVNLLVLGHIGSSELAAAALGNMMLVVVVYSP